MTPESTTQDARVRYRERDNKTSILSRFRILLTPPAPATRSTWAIFAIFAAAAVVRGPGVFVYDAQHYWLGASRVVGITPSAPEGYWALRGVLTAFVYTPAASVTRVMGEQFAPFAVLVQNSVFLAAVAAFLLPRVVARWHPLSARARWAGAVLAWLALTGFAPYPLVDIYAVAACLGVAMLLNSKSRLALLAAGACGGVAVNLRPAYLVTLLLILGICAFWRRWQTAFFGFGVMLALVPQSFFNAWKYDTWIPFPIGTSGLLGLQAGYASFIVRYDTVLDFENPSRFFCSPAMGNAVGNDLPATTGQLATTFLGNMPTSIEFSLQKIGAALHWQASSPYAITAPGLDALFAIFVTAVTVAGIATLALSAVRHGPPHARADWGNWAVLAAILGGGVLTLVSSATETRFALPLVLLGIVGCAGLANSNHDKRRIGGLLAFCVTLTVFATTYWLGHAGLGDRAPFGFPTPGICASLQTTWP